MEDTMAEDWLDLAKSFAGRRVDQQAGKGPMFAQDVLDLSRVCALIALVERLDKLISLKETQTGYGPIEVFEPDNPIPPVEDLEYKDDIPF